MLVLDCSECGSTDYEYIPGFAPDMVVECRGCGERVYIEGAFAKSFKTHKV